MILNQAFKSISSIFNSSFNEGTKKYAEQAQSLLVSKSKLGLNYLKIASRKLMVLGVLVSSFAFNSNSQQVSIGSPVDGDEDPTGSDIFFTVFLGNGAINTTGAPISGTISYSGTANSGLDYIEAVSFSIPDGGFAVTVTVVIIDDAEVECDETVIATVTTVNVGTIGTATSSAIITDDECNLGTEGINFNNSSVDVFPNPVKSSLNVQAAEPIQNYSIVDLNGRVMLAGKLSAMDVVLNVDSLPKGFYVLTVELGDGALVSKKVLKQ